MTREKAEAIGAEVLAIFRGYASPAATPTRWASDRSSRFRSCSREGGTEALAEIDLFELNEAFASQAVYVLETSSASTSPRST
jgi:acetyl-CoA acyltransferase